MAVFVGAEYGVCVYVHAYAGVLMFACTVPICLVYVVGRLAPVGQVYVCVCVDACAMVMHGGRVPQPCALLTIISMRSCR